MADFDMLELRGNRDVNKMLAKNGNSSETILFSADVVKFNKRHKAQPRVVMVTDRAVYNLKPKGYSCQRRVDIANITSLTVSSTSDEFVVHVPDEYDYRLASAYKDDFVEVLRKAHNVRTGSKMKVQYVVDDNLDVVVVTKEQRKNMTRESVIKRKRELAAESQSSDHEEHKIMGSVETLIGNGEKLSIDSFVLLKVLGRGSFGKVMQVKKKDDGKIYAMKILKKSMVLARHQVDHTMSERKILQVMQHPFLMGLKFAFQTETKLYLVMDFFRGGELFFHLKHKRRFSEEEARIFVIEVALALGHLHSLNFIYRDLKPENILMDEDGHVCLTDFGLSKEFEDPENPLANTFCGTPEYLAPEILIVKGNSDRGGPHGKAVDWWSLGILLYELTVGIPPFYSQNVNEMYHKIQHGVLRFPPFLSDECKDLIVALLNRNPEARLGSSERDVEELKEHPFFAPIDFEKYALFLSICLLTYFPGWLSVSSNLLTSPESREMMAMYHSLTSNSPRSL